MMRKPFLGLLLLSPMCFGQAPEAPLQAAYLELPKTNLISQGQSSTGSGFFIAFKSSGFLVTAKHVIWDLKRPGLPAFGTNLICITHSGPYEAGKDRIRFVVDLRQAANAGDLKYHPTRDVAVLRLWTSAPEVGSKVVFLPHCDQALEQGLSSATISRVDALYSTRFAAARPGDEIIIVGFPVSLGLAASPQIAPYEPLLRKSIIAGKNPIQRTLIIDSPAYFGNSGGAVWKLDKHDILNTGFSVAGVLTQFIPFDETKMNEELGRTNSSWAVSGYAVAEPMDFVIDLLEQGTWN